MRWPRGKYNGSRLGGFQIKVTFNLWWWSFPHGEWSRWCHSIHIGPLHIWIDPTYEDKRPGYCRNGAAGRGVHLPGEGLSPARQRYGVGSRMQDLLQGCVMAGRRRIPRLVYPDPGVDVPKAGDRGGPPSGGNVEGSPRGDIQHRAANGGRR